jgi:hypothetical protein
MQKAWSRLVTGCVAFAIFSSAYGQESSREEKIARTMRKIGAAWQRVMNERLPLVTEFRPGCFALHYLEKPANIEFDVRRTGQLLNPFVGFLKINGRVTRNDEVLPGEKSYKCFATAADALANTGSKRSREWISANEVMEAQYKITDKDISLEKVSDNFKSAFFPWLTRPDNSKLWTSTGSLSIE